MLRFQHHGVHTAVITFLLVWSVAFAAYRVLETIAPSSYDPRRPARDVPESPSATRTPVAPAIPAAMTVPTAPAAAPAPADGGSDGGAGIATGTDPDVAASIADFRGWFDDTFASAPVTEPVEEDDADDASVDEAIAPIPDDLRARIDALLASIATRS